MTTKSRIRIATAADEGAVRSCAEAAYAPFVERIGRPPAPMVADFAALIAAGKLHVCEIEKVAGFIVFFPRDGQMHLENVAVDPAFQGEGIGRRLISFCGDAARAAGLPAVELYTNAKMTENLTLYPRLGYVQTGRRVEEGFDRVFFRKVN